MSALNRNEATGRTGYASELGRMVFHGSRIAPRFSCLLGQKPNLRETKCRSVSAVTRPTDAPALGGRSLHRRSTNVAALRVLHGVRDSARPVVGLLAVFWAGGPCCQCRLAPTRHEIGAHGRVVALHSVAVGSEHGGASTSRSVSSSTPTGSTTPPTGPVRGLLDHIFEGPYAGL